jgi:lipopolysaccharide/colanic/teichoic acid biosynthesis glycosyltransferase
MVVDAEKILAELREKNSSMGCSSRSAKIRALPATARATEVGLWTSCLNNMLQGEMSLVGSRPAPPEEVAKYVTHVRRRLIVKAGSNRNVAAERSL